MKSKHGKLALLRLVGLDPWASGAILLLMIFWATLVVTIVTADPVSAPDLVQFTLYVALATTAVAGTILIWRICLYHRVFSIGIQVQGIISANYDYRQRAGSYSIRRIQVEYVYEYQGQRYKRRTDITRGWSHVFQRGQEVEVIVDPNKPKRAFIKQLYIT